MPRGQVLRGTGGKFAGSAGGSSKAGGGKVAGAAKRLKVAREKLAVARETPVTAKPKVARVRKVAKAPAAKAGPAKKLRVKKAPATKPEAAAAKPAKVRVAKKAPVKAASPAPAKPRAIRKAPVKKAPHTETAAAAKPKRARVAKVAKEQSAAEKAPASKPKRVAVKKAKEAPAKEAPVEKPAAKRVAVKKAVEKPKAEAATPVANHVTHPAHDEHAPLTVAQAREHFTKMGLEVHASDADLEAGFKASFSKNPSAHELRQLTGADHMPGEMSGNVSLLRSSLGNRLKINVEGHGVQMTRTYGESGAYHTSLFLAPGKQKTGLGKSIVRDQVRAYESLGVKKIDLFAGEVGRYVWPKLGFEASKSTVDHEKMQFSSWLHQNRIRAPELASRATSMRDIALATHNGRKVGKEYLLKASGSHDMEIHVGSHGFKTLKHELGI